MNSNGHKKLEPTNGKHYNLLDALLGQFEQALNYGHAYRTHKRYLTQVEGFKEKLFARMAEEGLCDGPYSQYDHKELGLVEFCMEKKGVEHECCSLMRYVENGESIGISISLPADAHGSYGAGL